MSSSSPVTAACSRDPAAGMPLSHAHRGDRRRPAVCPTPSTSFDQRRAGRAGGGEQFVADTLFRNVRVLAIGQLIEAKDGKKLAEGNTATRADPSAERSLASRLCLKSRWRVQHRRHGHHDQPTSDRDKRGTDHVPKKERVGRGVK
jgi:hypothetical protein